MKQVYKIWYELLKSRSALSFSNAFTRTQNSDCSLCRTAGKLGLNGEEMVSQLQQSSAWTSRTISLVQQIWLEQVKYSFIYFCKIIITVHTQCISIYIYIYIYILSAVNLLPCLVFTTCLRWLNQQMLVLNWFSHVWIYLTLWTPN